MCYCFDFSYGLLEGLLSHPVSEATLQEAFTTLSTINTATSSANANANANATRSVGASVNNGVDMSTVDVSNQEMPSDDKGYVYLQNLSREETIKVNFFTIVRCTYIICIINIVLFSI